MKGMNFTEVEMTAATLNQFIDSPDHWFEQKADGTRCLIRVVTEPGRVVSVEFLQRNGTPLKHTAAMQHFDGIRADMLPSDEVTTESILDGELMIDTGMFYAFDLPYFAVNGDPKITVDTPYHLRRYALETGITDETIDGRPGRIAFLPSAKTPEDKIALIEKVTASGGEGYMIKDINSTYASGVRVKHSIKVKFVKTADVVVTACTRARNGKEGRETGNFSFGVYNDAGVLVPLGAMSCIGKPDVPLPSVVEVKYLYRGADGGLVQPRFFRPRPDKAPEECTFEQFPKYSKAIV